MKLKYALFVGMTLLPAVAFAQSAGTVSLPKGNQINTPASVSAAVNAALQTKADTNNGVLNNAHLTGTPLAVTATPLANNTQIGTTGYTDLAVGVETTRSEAAEALKISLSQINAASGVAGLDALGNLSSQRVLPTGAYTDRTFAQRFSDIINVSDYGVICDGVTDNATAYSSLETRMNSAGAGATIFFPPSQTACLSSSVLEIKAGDNFFSYPGSVFLEPTSTSTVGVLQLDSNTYAYGLSINGGGTGSANTANLVTIYQSPHVTINQALAENTRGIPFEFSNPSYDTIQNSTLINVGGVKSTGNAQGISFTSGTTANNVGNNILDNTIINSGLDSINVGQTTGTKVSGNKCYNSLTTSEGACVYASNNAGILTIENNFSDHADGNAFDLFDNSDVVFTGNTAEYSANNGVGDFGNTSFTAVGNVLKDNGQGTGQVGSSGFAFSGSTTEVNGSVLLSANTVTDDQTTKTQQYAIYSNNTTTFSGQISIDSNNNFSGNLDSIFSGGGPLTSFTYPQPSYQETFLSSGSGTIPSYASHCQVIGIGGGSSGAGGGTVAISGSGGGGGGTGAKINFIGLVASGPYTVTIGSGGASASASSSGNVGGNTTITIGGATYTFPGAGAATATPGVTNAASTGGAGGAFPYASNGVSGGAGAQSLWINAASTAGNGTSAIGSTNGNGSDRSIPAPGGSGGGLNAGIATTGAGGNASLAMGNSLGNAAGGAATGANGANAVALSNWPAYGYDGGGGGGGGGNASGAGGAGGAGSQPGGGGGGGGSGTTGGGSGGAGGSGGLWLSCS